MILQSLKYCSIFLIIILTKNIFSQTYSNYVKKQGGVCFRTDDNQPITKYNEYSTLFSSYNQKFTCAINFGNDIITTDYISMLLNLQNNEHEIMDHTPWHRTNYFTTKLSVDFYQGHLGVEKIISNKILLKHVPVDLNYAQNFSKRNGIVNISNNIISSGTGDFKLFEKTDCYLYFPNLDKLVFIDEWINDNTVKVDDLWRNSISLGNHQNIKYYNLDVKNVHLTIDAIKALAQESIRMAEYYNLNPPTAWIQPGGYFPQIYRNEIKSACESELGYIAGGVFTDPSIKVFNEFNPNNDKQFGMNFGDFREDIWSLEECKTFIADRIAKHKVLMGHSHFAWGELLGGWDGFMERTENLIQWCIENDIPIRTYSEWSDILYFQTPDPYQNIFPNLSADKDNNNYPDGYLQRSRSSEGIWTNYEGIWTTNDGVAQSEYCSFSLNKLGNICYVGREYHYQEDGLGGIEKGENEFEIWTKGSPGNFIEVDFKVGNNHLIFKFPAESHDWTLYKLNESVNGSNSLTIPEDISTIDITISCSDYYSGSVHVSGMKLYKKYCEFELDTKIFLEGAYLQENEMSTALLSHFPMEQPFKLKPWNYDSSEKITEIPNLDITDWILVSLFCNFNDIIPKAVKVGFLKKDGKIVDVDGVSNLKFNVEPGNYFIKIQHRNHLSIMSSEPMHFVID